MLPGASSPWKASQLTPFPFFFFPPGGRTNSPIDQASTALRAEKEGRAFGFQALKRLATIVRPPGEEKTPQAAFVR